MDAKRKVRKSRHIIDELYSEDYMNQQGSVKIPVRCSKLKKAEPEIESYEWKAEDEEPAQHVLNQ